MFSAESGSSFYLLEMFNNFTGSLFVTLLLIVVFLLLMAILLRIPIEFTAILILPFLLSVTAYESSFISVTGVVLIYLGILLANNFWFR